MDELEKEEETRTQAGYYDDSDEEEDEETKNIQHLAAKIREKKKIMKVRAFICLFTPALLMSSLIKEWVLFEIEMISIWI